MATVRPTADDVSFERGVIRPMECLREGWDLIKSEYWLFFGITLVGMLVASAFAIVLMGPCTCGIYLCLLRRSRHQRVSFDMLFRGFDYFMDALVAGVLSVLASLAIIPVVAILMGVGIIGMSMLAHQQGPNAGIPVLFFGYIFFVYLLVFFLVTFIHLFFLFSYPLIVDRGLSGMDAVRVSLRAAWANFGGLFGLALLLTLLSMAGIALCIVGAYFLLPVNFATYTAAYLRMFPPSAQDDVIEELPEGAFRSS